MCGQPVHRYGWHIDLWDKGMNKNATWHCACVIAWQFWKAPSSASAFAPATAKLAVAYGRLQRSIIVSRCFGYGASIGTRVGRSCFIIGARQTFR